MADWFRREPVRHYAAGEEVADGPFPSQGAARRWCVACADALQAGDAEAKAALDAEAKAAREA